MSSKSYEFFSKFDEIMGKYELEKIKFRFEDLDRELGNKRKSDMEELAGSLSVKISAAL